MTQARSREEVLQRDRDDLHKLGYAQELYRSMGGFSNFAISFSIISILTGAVMTVAKASGRQHTPTACSGREAAIAHLLAAADRKA